MQILGLYLACLVSAAWFPHPWSSWTGSADKDENMRKGQKSSLLETESDAASNAGSDAASDATSDAASAALGEALSAARGDEDQSEELQSLQNEIQAANEQDEAESENIKQASQQALANLDNLATDVSGAMNNTVAGQGMVQQAGTSIKNSAVKAKQAVQAVVDLDKSASAKMAHHADMLTEKAANAALAISAKGAGYLTKMKGDFDVSYLSTDQGITRDLTDIKNRVEKSRQATNAAMDKTQIKNEMLVDKLHGMTSTLNDKLNDIVPKLKDLNNNMKADSKGAQKEYDVLFKNIKKEISDGELINDKDTLKTLKQARENVEDRAEDSVKSAEDRADDMVGESAKNLKVAEKAAAKQAKTMTKKAEKTAIEREKYIKRLTKGVEGNMNDVKKLEGRIKSEIVDSVEGATRDMMARIGEKSTNAAVDQSEMFKRLSENAEKTMQGVQVNAQAAAAKMNSDNGRDASDAASSSYKVVQTLDEEAKTVSMGINNKIGGVTATVSTAKNSVASASDALADVEAEIEAAKLAAKSQQEKAAALATRATQAMTNDVQALDLDMKIKMESAQTDLRNEKDAFNAKSASVKPALEMPITQAAETVARELESGMNQMAIKTNEQMGELKTELKNVKQSMQSIGVDPNQGAPSESKVLTLVESSMHDVSAMERAKANLQREVEKTPQWAEIKTGMATKELESYARKAQQDIVKSQLDQIRETEGAVFHNLGVEAKKLDQLKGKTVATGDRQEQQNEYLEKRIAALVDDMGSFKVEHDEVSDMLRGKNSEFQDELMPQYGQTAQAAAEAVKQSADQTVANGEAGLQSLLKDENAKMTEDAEARGQATRKELHGEEDRILKRFDSAKAGEAEGLSRLYAQAEGLKFDTKNATETLREEQDKATDEATKADESAQLAEAKVANQIQQSDTDAQNLGDMVTKMTQESIEYAKRSAHGQILSKGQMMEENVAKLAQQANGAAASADHVVKGELNAFDTLSREAKEKLKSVKEKSEFSKKDQEAFGESLKSQVEEESQKEHDEEETLQRGLDREEDHFNIGESRNKEIVKVMEEDAKDVRKEADDALNEVKANVDAKTKAMAGKIDASFDAAKMTANTAHDSLVASKLDLAAAKRSLFNQMGSVQTELNHKADETSQAIAAFDKGLQLEKAMLDKNEAYLHAYDLSTQSQILAILHKVESAIGGSAATAAGGFNEIEESEKVLSQKLDAQMGSSAFSALQRIMDADNYVQKAAIENNELIGYLKEFKGDQETFMGGLIKALYDVQYAVILHENEQALEQSAMDADADAMTSNVIGQLHNLVDGNATNGEADVLEGMTEGTLQMLLAKAANGSEQDKAQIALLMKKINQNGLGALARLKNAQALVDAINNAVNGNTNYEAMKADLQSVVDFNQKLVDDERKRMEGRGVKLTDKLFFGGADLSKIKTPDAFKHVKLSDRQEYMHQAVIKVQESYKRDAVEALLERQRVHASTAAARKAVRQAQPSPRMQSLLEKNQALMAESKQLAEEHDDLGKKIREVTSKLKGAKHASSL